MAIKPYLEKTFVRFLLVGMLNTLFGYSIFSILIFYKFHYTFAMLLATILGVLFNFKTTGKLVFDNSHNKLIFKFIVAYTAIYFLNISIIKLFSYASVNLYLSGCLAILVSTVVSYFLNKNFVFGKSI